MDGWMDGKATQDTTQPLLIWDTASGSGAAGSANRNARGGCQDYISDPPTNIPWQVQVVVTLILFYGTEVS